MGRLIRRYALTFISLLLLSQNIYAAADDFAFSSLNGCILELSKKVILRNTLYSVDKKYIDLKKESVLVVTENAEFLTSKGSKKYGIKLSAAILSIDSTEQFNKIKNVAINCMKEK